MDVSHYLDHSAAAAAWTAVLTIFSLVFFAVAAVTRVVGWERKARKRSRRILTTAVAAGIICLFAEIAVSSSYEHRTNPDLSYETALFDTYGITGSPLRTVRSAGPDGVLATVKRDGQEIAVKIVVRDNWLSFIGSDGLPLPTNAERQAAAGL